MGWLRKKKIKLTFFVQDDSAKALVRQWQESWVENSLSAPYDGDQVVLHPNKQVYNVIRQRHIFKKGRLSEIKLILQRARSQVS